MMTPSANGAATPEPEDGAIDGASVAVVSGRNVLLIRRHRPPFAGRWTLPGGRLEPGEVIEACAIREVREELGLSIGALRPVMRMIVPADPPLGLAVFATDRFSGTITPLEIEIAAWGWVPPEALDGLETTPRLAEVVGRALALFGKA